MPENKSVLTFEETANERITPRVRTERAEMFLMELGRGIPETERVMVGYAPEATVQTDETGKKVNRGWWPVPWRAGKWINERTNCYACISSSIQTPHPKKPGVMRYWIGEESFGHGLALMVDDIGTGKGSKGKLDVEEVVSILPPTAIVETSPDNFQFWYFLRAPEPRMDYFKAFLRAFVDQVLDGRGGDSTIKNVSRYGRQPTGINNKRISEDHGAGFKYPIDDKGNTWHVKLRACDYSLRYTVGELAEAFNVDFQVPVFRERRRDKTYDSYDELCLQAAVRVLDDAKQGEGSGGRLVLNGSGSYRIKCPWGNEHKDDPFGGFLHGPKRGNEFYCFSCSHHTCKAAKRGWNAFMDITGLDARVNAWLERELMQADQNWTDADFEALIKSPEAVAQAEAWEAMKAAWARQGGESVSSAAQRSAPSIREAA